MIALDKLIVLLKDEGFVRKVLIFMFKKEKEKKKHCYSYEKHAPI